MRKPGHYVHIISYTDRANVKTMGPYPSDRLAESAERGINRNLNHESYYTRIEEVET